MSKMGDKLDRKVAVTLTVSDWIMVHDAMTRYQVTATNISPLLHDDYERTRIQLRDILGTMLDREFPVES